jgi:hypothetical protein
MRQLDGERQSLVYNHHHELIAATDTISAVSRLVARWSSYTYVSQMKTRADELDSKLELLRASFDEISRLSAEVAIESSPSPS